MGRRTKLTKAVRDDVVRYITMGCTITDSATLAGISTSTFYDWLARAERPGQKIYSEFADAVEEATARYREHHLAAIRKGALETSRTVTLEVVEVGEQGEPGYRRRRIRREVTHPPDPRFSQWLLERRWPEEFGRASRIRHEGEIDNPSATAAAAPPVTLNLVFDDGKGESGESDNENHDAKA